MKTEKCYGKCMVCKKDLEVIKVDNGIDWLYKCAHCGDWVASKFKEKKAVLK